MQQRSILITGCSSGIGRCTALGLHQRGYRVFATARQQADIDELESLGIAALYLDYCDSDSIHAAFNSVMEATGGALYALFVKSHQLQPVVFVKGSL